MVAKMGKHDAIDMRGSNRGFQATLPTGHATSLIARTALKGSVDGPQPLDRSDTNWQRFSADIAGSSLV